MLHNFIIFRVRSSVVSSPDHFNLGIGGHSHFGCKLTEFFQRNGLISRHLVKSFLLKTRLAFFDSSQSRCSVISPCTSVTSPSPILRCLSFLLLFIECGGGTRSRTEILGFEIPDAIHYTIPPRYVQIPERNSSVL